MTKAAVERREARRPDRKGRKTLRKRLDVPRKHFPGASQAPRVFRRSAPLARPQVRKEEGKRINPYGAAGAAKQTASGAMPEGRGQQAAAIRTEQNRLRKSL